MYKGLVVLAIVANHAVQTVQELLGLHSKKDLGQVQCLQEGHSQAVSTQEKGFEQTERDPQVWQQVVQHDCPASNSTSQWQSQSSTACT